MDHVDHQSQNDTSLDRLITVRKQQQQQTIIMVRLILFSAAQHRASSSYFAISYSFIVVFKESKTKSGLVGKVHCATSKHTLFAHLLEYK